jgi:hypothetical protein
VPPADLSQLLDLAPGTISQGHYCNFIASAMMCQSGAAPESPRPLTPAPGTA